MVDRFLDCCGIRGLLTVGRKGLTVDRGQLTEEALVHGQFTVDRWAVYRKPPTHNFQLSTFGAERHRDKGTAIFNYQLSIIHYQLSNLSYKK